MSSDEIAIRVQGLGKCYQIYQAPRDRLKQFLWRGRRNFYREFWALKDISFEVKRGETMGVIGRNGSGKSTMLSLIAGTLTPTVGGVETNGRIAALLELGSGFNPEFTGRENVFLNGSILGIARKEMEEKFDAIASFADIGEFIDQPVKTYSSGMRARLAFAVSVHVNPEILIVDEVLSVGDAVFAFKCKERLDHLTRSGTTMLFVSHDLGAVKTFCDRAVYLVNGQVRSIGSSDEVTELYLMDTRNDRSAQLQRTPVQLKPALSGPERMAFGTSEGRITRAVFLDGSGMQAAFSYAERVVVHVEVEVESKIGYPCVTMLIQDRNLLGIAGETCPVRARDAAPGSSLFAVQFGFDARFGKGKYYITLRLENRITERNFELIDKQSGALCFEVVPKSVKDVVGIVDMQIEGRVVPVAASL